MAARSTLPVQRTAGAGSAIINFHGNRITPLLVLRALLGRIGHG
ncbi:MAG TPA: hypothetical protein VHD76_07255 [Bryobacteraceae bacterium]|nr:hypothetical protein [Bryobacteraceae bacterium]